MLNFPPGWGTVPPLVHVAQELVTADQHVAGVAHVADDALKLPRAVHKIQLSVHDVRRHPAFQV